MGRVTKTEVEGWFAALMDAHGADYNKEDVYRGHVYGGESYPCTPCKGTGTVIEQTEWASNREVPCLGCGGTGVAVATEKYTPVPGRFYLNNHTPSGGYCVMTERKSSSITHTTMNSHRMGGREFVEACRLSISMLEATGKYIGSKE